MWDHIINIHSSELLRTKSKSLEVMNIRRKKIENLHFLPNNNLTRLFKELKNIYKNDY